MDISVLKLGTSYDHVVFITEVTQPFSIVIDGTYTMLPHHIIPANVVVPRSSIQVSQHHKKIVCWDLVSHCLQLVVKSIFVCLLSIFNGGIAHYHCQLGVL